jgi:hypothetical protein
VDPAFARRCQAAGLLSYKVFWFERWETASSHEQSLPMGSARHRLHPRHRHVQGFLSAATSTRQAAGQIDAATAAAARDRAHGRRQKLTGAMVHESLRDGGGRRSAGPGLHAFSPELPRRSPWSRSRTSKSDRQPNLPAPRRAPQLAPPHAGQLDDLLEAPSPLRLGIMAEERRRSCGEDDLPRAPTYFAPVLVTSEPQRYEGAWGKSFPPHFFLLSPIQPSELPDQERARRHGDRATLGVT